MKEIQLTRGQVALVDDEDYEWLSQWKWHARFNLHTQSYYASRTDRSNGKAESVMMHRQIMRTPKGMFCDHIKHNTLDNRKSELRNVTNAQNAMNRKVSSSKYKGITKHRKNWKAQLMKDGVQVYNKTFPTALEAAKAYDEAAKRFFGEFANTNF